MPQALKRFLRALVLRCPNCGNGGVLRSWFHLRAHCPRCGLALERGEAEDYFTGGMMFNIVLVEIIFGLVLMVLVVATWPAVPWTLLQWLGIPLMALAPVLLYPVSKLVWLAWDLAFRPVRREELRRPEPPRR